MKEIRCGIGFDVHAFTEGRKLILGGVEIESSLGLAGHSDADVLIHAIIDALFGAAGMGDIGRHYPDTDRKYRNISSLLLLEDTAKKIYDEGWKISNIDATIIAQRPKLSGYIGVMRGTLAKSLRLGIDQISVKSTTTDKLGFTGREEGIAALATAVIFKLAHDRIYYRQFQ
jgi:2-C-methyl-D-erythritol 2,4-cyclodiphosphate synthase